MSLLKNIRNAVQKAASRFAQIFKPKPRKPAAPTREQLRTDAEKEANQRAIWAIQNAMQNPQDKTAQEGRKQAIEYLSRAEALKKGGKLQDWNRQQMAERWSRSELSSAEGQQARKDKKLEVFNQNFNIDLNQEQADLLGDMMETDSYQKLAETYKGIYGDLIEAIGEAIESGQDPQRIEQTLYLFNEYDIQPEFDTFKQVLELESEDFNSLQADIQQQAGSLFYQNEDEIGKQERMEAILGNYIDWR